KPSINTNQQAQSAGTLLLQQQHQRALEAARRNPSFQSKVAQVLELFPDFAAEHARIIIELDLLRNNGNIDSTCEKILSGRLIVPLPPAPTSTSSNASSVKETTGFVSTVDFSKPIGEAPLSNWETNPESRQMNLRQRKEYMLKQARQKFLEQQKLQDERDITVTSNEIVLGVQSEETDSNFISHDVEAHFMGIATITWINSKQGEKSFTFTFWTATSTSELNPDFDNPVIKLTFLNTMPSSFEHIWNDHLELGTKLTLPALNIKTEPEIFHLDSIPDLKTHRVDQNSLAKSTSITQPYPISLSASIPAGFCVLEKNFKILIEVRNGSPFPIEAIEFVIIQHFQFLGQANSDCEEIEFEKIVKSTVFMGVDPHEEKLDDLTDLISSVLPTTLISVETTPDKHIGTHLKIWYTARLTTKMPSFSEISDLVVTLPLTIYNHEPTLTFLESIAPPLPPRLETDAEISSLFVPSRITSSSKSQSMPSLNLFSPSVVTPRQRNRTNKSLSTPIKVSPRTVSKRLPRNSVPLTLHHWVSSIVKSDGVQLFHFDCTDIAKNDSEMGSLCLYLITDSDSGIRISRNRLPTWWNFDLREECATEVDASVDYILGDSSENLNEKNSATEQEYFCRLVLGDGRYYIKVFGGNFERKVNPLHIQFDRRERNIRPITSFRISVTRIIPVAKEIAERVQSGMVWRKSDGIDLDIFDDAWTVGFDINGESLFAARANVGKSLQIGKVGSHMKSAMVTFG
ncbi:hypothetical protein HK096_004739, partial [Nowakowskiella sp. JEL0078]